MSFIGIITNQKNEPYITKKLSSILPTENIVFITEKSINNIKNVKFETIVIDKDITNKIDLEKIIANCKYLIINTDRKVDLEDFKAIAQTIITFGFNHKSTFTVSSVEDENIIICLQRIILNKNNNKIEPQEYKMSIDENTDKYIIIAIEILKILYS